MKNILLMITIAFALTACGEPDPHDLEVKRTDLVLENGFPNEKAILKFRKVCYPKSLEEFKSWFCESGCPGYPKCANLLGLGDYMLKDAKSGWKMKYEWKK